MSLKSIATSTLARVWFGETAAESEYAHPIAHEDAGNRLISETIATGLPCMISRVGSVELGICRYYLRWRRDKIVKFSYPRAVTSLLGQNAGFFPLDAVSLDRFADTYLDALRSADVMAVWLYPGERALLEDYCPDARLVSPRSLYAMLFSQPWSGRLAGKMVLVVHPFAETITSQYAHHRRELFADPCVLPEFDLKTVAAPQTITGETGGFASWFEALDDVYRRIDELTYDIALIGAGAYGLPIAAHVKRRGKQALHIGGVTQLFFGIKGRRWEVDSQDDIVPLFNECWVRPSAAETPSNASLVEDGCYW